MVSMPKSLPAWKEFAVRIARRRDELSMTIRQLSAKTAEVDGADGGVQAAQISRIENRKIVPDLREVYLLLNALGLRPDDVFEESGTRWLPPWYVVRGEDATRKLRELSELREKDPAAVGIQRANAAHQKMIARGSYMYVPLTADVARLSERSGDMRRIMQAYLFKVTHEEDAVLKNDGLNAHEGEEIIYVISGSIDFWHRSSDEGPIERTSLGTGDLIHFQSRLEHGYRAIGPSATALFVYTRETAQFDTPQEISLRTNDDIASKE